ncbi:MAG: deoxyribonuclease IV [Halobacteriales archaeon]
MRIGAHVSIAGGVDNAVERQLEVGGNCGQIFTTSPRVWADPDIDDEEAATFREDSAAKLEGPWVIHANYLINLATPKDDLREKSRASLQADLDAADRLDVPYLCVHLGAHTGAGEDRGLENAIGAIDRLEIPSGVTLLVESDAGSGSKLGGRFEHLATVVEGFDPDDVAVCLDTAHMFAAGYDLATPEAVDETVAAFDEAVGLDRLEVMHLNDSKHACGTNKDEHAHVGEGEIGEDGMRAVLRHDGWADRPFILETPEEDGKGFAWNVARAKELRGA